MYNKVVRDPAVATKKNITVDKVAQATKNLLLVKEHERQHT